MSKKGHLIKSVDSDSIADQLELEPGDSVLTIDGQKLEDIFDYQYYINSESIVMAVRKANGEEWELDIEHGYEDLGITFENGLMSEYKSCRNQCIFCFIDQMPPGMRDTLYFKDDDSRLSFLQGNYITLTNMSEKDLDRIIKFKLSPINISVHTTNPDLRCQMLHNRFAGDVLSGIDRLYKAHTPMNSQIVLCPGVNDKAELERSIRDLSRYIPCMESVSVVPVGLSRYREGLYPLKAFTRESAAEAVKLIEHWQEKLFQEHGTHFVHASDELYILAGYSLPEESRYDGYLQLENGVGMLRLLTNEIKEEISSQEGDERTEELSIATGVLAYPFLKQYVESIQNKFPGKAVHLYPITNEFFGEQITVAGLITGSDLMKQLKGKKLGKRLLLPACMFRDGEEVFLDDVTREQLQKALQVPVNIVKSSGYDFVHAIIDSHVPKERSLVRGTGGYELKEIKYE